MSPSPTSSPSHAPSKKSTSVRIPPGLRPALRGLAFVSTPLASRVALRLFRTPPRHVESELEKTVVADARRDTLSVSGTAVPLWIWGSGPPVLLVHGWGSRGARLGSFVAPLVAAGHTVIAFDAPGHGATAERLSSLPQFIFSIEEAYRRYGRFAAIVAHSMGGASTTLAMARGVRADRVVFIAPAADPAGYVRYFAALLGLPDAVRQGMEDRIVRRFGMRWSEYDVAKAARSLSVPLLIFHDADDGEVPVSSGEAIAAAWPGSRLVKTEGLGHKRIVHDADVVAGTVAFLTGSRARAASSS